jgi:insulin-like growth factor-binding protein complex acid labile subunit
LSLRHLNLAKNNISNWVDINPNVLLVPASNLFELNLSKNLFTSLSSVNHDFVLLSNSLRFLDLSGCKISKISGQQAIQGLPNLDHLKLDRNPLKTITDMVSPSLLTLDLSNCLLTNLRPTLFEHMPVITSVNLARNHRLSLINRNDFVRSDSLKKIDLSYCNMDNIELDGFPNLMTAVLRGNMVRQLEQDSFVRNKVLENLDIAYNSISTISPYTFREMKHLKHLDLSFNMISRVERDTFKMNEVLTSINLSRNYLSRLSRISGASVATLNMSWCEILTIDPDALSGMPDLVELDLSNNLITHIPDNLESGTLQTLDFSMCRYAKWLMIQ